MDTPEYPVPLDLDALQTAIEIAHGSSGLSVENEMVIERAIETLRHLRAALPEPSTLTQKVSP